MNKGLGYGSGPFSFIMGWIQQTASIACSPLMQQC